MNQKKETQDMSPLLMFINMNILYG